MKDKVVIITGASSGIGLALAGELYRRGCKICLASRNEDGLHHLKLDLENKFGQSNNILIVKTDVGKEEDCKNLIFETIRHFGNIDILINNAGISMRAIFEDVDLSVIRKLMEVNFWGSVYCTKYALPHLLKSKGSVVGISSIAGYKGLPARTGYSASKFALQGFLETLRIENINTGLHVLIACPGFTASNIRKTALSKDGSMQGETPRKEEKMMQADEVAIKISNAIEKRKNRLTLTLQGKLLVFLSKFFPKWTDRIVFNHMAKEPDSPIKLKS